MSDYVAVLEGVPKLTGDEKVEDILKEARGSMVCHATRHLDKVVSCLVFKRHDVSDRETRHVSHTNTIRYISFICLKTKPSSA